jgi:ABC-type multidrug transport system fused ATPase/permease subunit
MRPNPRFYAPQRGSITFDGVNTVDLDPRWLHKQLAIVSQEPVLFRTSVLENIAYGDARAVADPAEPPPEPPPELTLEQETALRQRVVECAMAANAHDFITSFPNGYDTMVRGGTAVSQRSRQCCSGEWCRKPQTQRAQSE